MKERRKPLVVGGVSHLTEDALLIVAFTFDQVNSGELSLAACIREDRWLAEWLATRFIAARDDFPLNRWTATPRIHRVFHFNAELRREQRCDYDSGDETTEEATSHVGG